MSRSYRKPYATQQGKAKRFFKQKFNQDIRKEDDIPDGNAYRKMRNSYDISDYRWLCEDDPKLRRK